MSELSNLNALPYARKSGASEAQSGAGTEVRRHNAATETGFGSPRSEIIERAEDLIPLLRKNEEETEQKRRVVEENIEALAAAGLFKVTVPKRFGGFEGDMRTIVGVSRALAQGCGATAWVATLTNVCAWFVGLGGAELQEDIWGANPEARVAGVFAPSATSKREPGGYRVTGKWPWASGSLHADWFFVGLPLVDEDDHVVGQGFAVFPASEGHIEDTWYVSGMQGTGSNTIVASDIFIPDHRVMNVSDILSGNPPTPFKDEALYQAAFVPVAALVLAGPQLGLCTRAMEFVQEKAPKRGISYSFYNAQTESPSFQLGLAEAATTIDIAHLLAYGAADTIDSAAREGRKLDHQERARLRMHIAKSISSSREAIDILLSCHGAGSFALVSPMQRIWRDSETASRHAVLSPMIAAEVFGRSLVGIEEGVTALV